MRWRSKLESRRSPHAREGHDFPATKCRHCTAFDQWNRLVQKGGDVTPANKEVVSLPRYVNSVTSDARFQNIPD